MDFSKIRFCKKGHAIIGQNADGTEDDTIPWSGLQFFADRAAALREMRRVIGAEGRLALMVWRGIHESPGFAVMAEALERHIGQAAAAIMRAPFGLSNADELEALVRVAGFQNVAIQQRSGTVRFPSVERFVLSYVAGSPLAGPVSKADDAARQALITDVGNAWERTAAIPN